MGITNDIKDTARKVTNSVIDTTQEVLDISKSPKELAGRVVEHLSRQEYHEVSNMLSAEVKKYIDNSGLKDSTLVSQKLEDFQQAAASVADNFENNDYKQVKIGLEKLEQSIPDEIAKSFGTLSTVKKILKNIIDTLKKHIEAGTVPEFSNLTTVFEDLFTESAGSSKLI